MLVTLLERPAVRRFASRLARLGIARDRIEQALAEELEQAVHRLEVERLISSARR
jgi:hypothetical protein